MPIFPKSLLFLSFLLLSSTPSQSFSCKYGALFYLSHSLISRVPALRTARGDVEGAARARALVDNLKRVYGLTMVLDYIKNYDRKDATSFRDLCSVASDLNVLLGVLRGLNLARSDEETAAWAGRNYKNALWASQSLFDRLLKDLKDTPYVTIDDLGPVESGNQAVAQKIVNEEPKLELMKQRPI